MASEETGDEFYEDARTSGPGEFFLEEEHAESVLEEDEDDYYEEEEDDYDEEEEIEIEKEATRRKISNASKVVRDEVDPSSIKVDRRKILPAACSGEEFSMLAMLRKNVGKVSCHSRFQLRIGAMLMYRSNDRIYQPSPFLSRSTNHYQRFNVSPKNWNILNYCTKQPLNLIQSSD